MTITALNGQLPAAQLATADTGPNGPQQLRVDAAASWARMLAAGLPAGHLRSGYRTLAQQAAEVAAMNAGLTPSALPPGRSQHGEGLAADVDEPARSWVWAHGAGYGWIAGRVPNEPWHMEYQPARDQHAGEITAAPPTPLPPPEDIVATLAELQTVIDQAIAPVLAQLRPHTLLRIAGTRAAWLDLGTARRFVSAEQYAALQSPPIRDLPATDPFWTLPIAGVPGELVRRTGQAACWLLGPGGRQWVQADQYAADRSPVITDLPASDPLWSLPTTGALPPEGA